MSCMFAGHTSSQGGNPDISVITTRLELCLTQGVQVTFHSFVPV